MAKDNKPRVRCRGYKRNGDPCGKNTTDPTGYCYLHKGNPGKPKSQRDSKTKSTIPNFWSEDNSAAFGAKLDNTQRPWEGGSFNAAGGFDRPKLEGRSVDNWKVPEVKAAARRYAVSQRHLKQLAGNMKAVQGIVDKRLAAKSKDGKIEAGTHTFSEGGVERIKLEIKDTKGNFSGKRFEDYAKNNKLDVEALKDYGAEDIDVRKLPDELKKPPYYNPGADRTVIKSDFEEGDAIDDKYQDLYDKKKLEHWPTGRLIEEYQSMEDIQNDFKSLVKEDEKYLKDSLPNGAYSDTDSDIGSVTTTLETKAGNRKWDKDAVRGYYENNPGETMPTKQTFTAKSVREGDKLHGTDYYGDMGEQNKKPTWGGIDYV